MVVAKEDSLLHSDLLSDLINLSRHDSRHATSMDYSLIGSRLVSRPWDVIGWLNVVLKPHPLGNLVSPGKM